MLFFFLFGGLAIYYILTTRLIVGNNSYKRNTDYPLIEFSLNINIDHLKLQSVYFAKIENADRDSGVKFKLQVLGIDDKIFPGGGMSLFKRLIICLCAVTHFIFKNLY